jgi:hypothetical protein
VPAVGEALYTNGIIATQAAPAVAENALATQFPGESPDYTSLEGSIATSVLILAMKPTGARSRHIHGQFRTRSESRSRHRRMLNFRPRGTPGTSHKIRARLSIKADRAIELELSLALHRTRRERDRNRAGGVNRLPSLSAREEPHGRAGLDDTGDIATPTGAEMSRQLKRLAVFLEPASMWSATIPLSQ